MPGSLFPQGVGWGEVVDSLLMGTVGGGGGGDGGVTWSVCLCYPRAERGLSVAGATRTAEKLCPRAPGPWRSVKCLPGDAATALC